MHNLSLNILIFQNFEADLLLSKTNTIFENLDKNLYLQRRRKKELQ